MVVLLDPLRVAILQHVEGPGCLHRRVVCAGILKLKLKDSPTPAVPAIRPRTVGTLVVKDTLDPTAPHQIGSARSENESTSLVVRITNPEVPIRVPCGALADRIYGTIQFWRRSVEVTIDIQCQQLDMQSGSPTVFGSRS